MEQWFEREKRKRIVVLKQRRVQNSVVRERTYNDYDELSLTGDKTSQRERE